MIKSNINIAILNYKINDRFMNMFNSTILDYTNVAVPLL